MAVNWGGGLAGAGTGFAMGGPVGAALGGLAGLFGNSGPSISPEQRALLKLQKNAAQQLQDYSRSIPGSSPQELAALASQRGLLGQQQRGLMSGMFANLGAGGAANSDALLRDLAVQFQGQQSAAASGLFGQFLGNRQNALLQSAQIAQGALGAAQPNQPGFSLGEIIAKLAEQYAYQKALKPGGQQGTNAPGLQPAYGTVNVGSSAPLGFNFGGGMGLGNVGLNPGRLQLPGLFGR